MSNRCAAFTLLEICLVLLIGMTLIMIAVPSVAGLLAEQRLNETWNRFELLVNTARFQSMKEQRPCRLIWEKHRIVLAALDPKAGKSGETSSLVMAGDEDYELLRTAALINPAPPEWTFWPNGACEPAIISYHGRSGRWQVRFDALSPKGTFQKSETF